MEYRPNSHPERTGPYMTGLITNQRSADTGPDRCRGHSPILPLKRAINYWLPPKYPAYSTFTSRLNSFKNWAQGMSPSPESMSKAVSLTADSGFAVVTQKLVFCTSQRDLHPLKVSPTRYAS